MARPAPDGPDGLLIVDKPAAMTSHDVVTRVRRLAGTRKVGHAGTLDPMVTGVLVLGTGRATRLLTFLVGCDKDYTATIRLGQGTVTDDAGGATVAVDAIARSGATPIKRHDPGHPLADAEGYVWDAAVDPELELVEMLEASRQYQNNMAVLDTAKTLILDTIKLGSR